MAVASPLSCNNIAIIFKTFPAECRRNINKNKNKNNGLCPVSRSNNNPQKKIVLVFLFILFCLVLPGVMFHSIFLYLFYLVRVSFCLHCVAWFVCVTWYEYHSVNMVLPGLFVSPGTSIILFTWCCLVCLCCLVRVSFCLHGVLFCLVSQHTLTHATECHDIINKSGKATHSL